MFMLIRAMLEKVVIWREEVGVVKDVMENYVLNYRI